MCSIYIILYGSYENKWFGIVDDTDNKLRYDFEMAGNALTIKL